MSFCLPKFATEALKGKFKSGEISPDKLSEMTSEQRRATFSFLGEENAKQVNALFESKLLLKNQQAGFVRWAEKILKDKPDAKKDFLMRVEKMTDVLSVKEQDAFLSDLVEKRLGIGITTEQAGKLVDLSKRVEEYKAQLPKEMSEMDNKTYLKQETPQQLEARLRYGTALVMFKDYVSSLKPESKNLSFKEYITTPSKYIENLGAIAKSIKASLDNSFWGNQGVATLLNPKTTDIWVRNFLKSFKDISQALAGKDPTIAAKAEAFSRPDAVNGTYSREKLAVGLNTEEAYPTSLPERIPGFGRLFKASSAAYNAAALRLRVDVADRINAAARKAGGDLVDKGQAEAIGHIVNSSTGRGTLGKAEPIAPKLNILVFSAKLMKGAFDTLTAHVFDSKVRTDPFARKLAAKNLLGIAATVTGIMAISEALNPGSTDPDPRGAHFGQIKVGNSWINITGPFRPIVRTAATLLPTYHNGELGFWRRNDKGVWTGIKLYPTKDVPYGMFTPLDLAESFFENKASPLFATIMNHWRGADFQGRLPTPGTDLENLVAPITITNYLQDKKNPNVDNLLINTIFNAFGFSPSTKTPKK